MTAPQIVFHVGPGGSSPLTAADRTRLFALSTAIYKHVGENPSASWYAMRCQYSHGPFCFALDIAGSIGTLNIILLQAPETMLPLPSELPRKLSTGTLTLPVADATDAFYLSLFLFDNLAVKPAFDAEQIIVPRSIRHGLGVFSW